MKRQRTLCGTLFAICLGVIFPQIPAGSVWGQEVSPLFGEPNDAAAFVRNHRDLRIQDPEEFSRKVNQYLLSRFKDAGSEQERDRIKEEMQQALFSKSAQSELQDQLKRRLRDVDSGEQRELVMRALEESLSQEFAQDMKNRRAELEQIKDRVADMEAHLEKRAAAKDDIIELRLQVLVNQAEGLGWAEENRASLPGAAMRRIPSSLSGFERGVVRFRDFGRFDRQRTNLPPLNEDETDSLQPKDAQDENANEEVPEEQPKDSDSDDFEEPRN